MKKYSIIFSSLLLLISLGCSMPTYAQRKAKKNKTTKSALLLDVKTKVVDEDGKAIQNAEIIVSEGALVAFTDKNGEVSLKVKANGIVLVEALGHEDVTIDLASTKLPKVIKMKKTQYFENAKYQHNRHDGGSTSHKNMVGSIYSLSGKELESHPDFNLSNTLQGRLAGVTVRSTTSGLGNATSSIYVRGQHRNDDNGAIVIVDGIERDWEDIIPEEVEKIEVMKDASAKILYGPRAANGVLVVTTRRGEANKRVIRTSVEAGIMQATRLPKYLDSYQYASLYNEARANDGLPYYYSQQQLDGYKNSKGVNDLLYPNVDYYDYFIGDQVNYRKAFFDMNGGNNKIKYALIANYINGEGLEKVGKRPNLNRLNVRGNLDVRAASFLSFVADAAVRLETRNINSKGNDQVFSALSSTRPNEYPLTINSDILGLTPDEDGTPFFGASLRNSSNLYADLEYGGFADERYITSQTNLGVKFHLDEVIKGLSASGFVTFDNYNYYKKGQTNVYPTYALIGNNGDNTYSFAQMKNQSLQANQSKMSETTNGRLGWRANIGYQRSFAKHDLEAILAYNFYNKEVNGASQDIKNSNTTLRINYGYDNKYLFEGTLASMGSNKFHSDNRYFVGGAVGLGWILSNEQFIKDIAWIDYLKLKGSWGILGYDRSTEWLLYKSAWADASAIKFGEQNNNSVHVTNFIRSGNKNLKWEQSKELNIGLEALLLGGRLNVEVNYFNELRDNIITSTSASMQDMLGGFAMPGNVGRVRNHGVDFYAQWKSKINEIKYSVGANLVWSKNKLLAWNEVNFPEKYLNSVGQATDIITGYQALGLFGKNVDINRPIYQALGIYGVGDIAYKDLNKDQIIDGRDMTTIGHSFPSTSLGIDLNVGYKGWNLSVLGTAQVGFETLRNNSYYWGNNGEGKYSVVALDRYHPENNPKGSYPRLSTINGDNNYVKSTYWLQDGSFFRLKNVELSYTFDFSTKNLGLKKLTLFGRGANLFVLSKEKDLDPEVSNAGIGNYPLFTTFTGGFTMTF